MRAPVVVLVAICATVLVAGCLGPGPSASDAAGHATAPQAKDAPTASPTPGPFGRFADDVGATGGEVEKVDKGLTTILVTGLKWLLMPFGLVLLVAVLARLWRLVFTSRPQLVLEELTNASGDSGLDKVMPGLSQLAREQLVAQLKLVHGRVKLYSRAQARPGQIALPPGLPPPEQVPLPAGAADQRLGDLLSSIKALAPAQVGSFIQILGLAASPRGTRVKGSIQRQGDAPGTLGITFEVSDMRGEREPKIHTTWELRPASIARPESAPGPPAAQAPTARQRAEPFARVGSLLAQVALFEEATDAFGQALKLDPTFAEAAQALALSVSKTQVQKGAAAAYATGRKLQDANLVSATIDAYIRPLRQEDRAGALLDWQTVLGAPSGDNKGAAYLRLARLYRDGPHLHAEAMALYRAAVEKGSTDANREKNRIQRDTAAALTEAAEVLHNLARYGAAEKYLTAALEHVPEHPRALAVLAAVRAAKPPDENKDAVAFYTLGQIYQGRGALEQAKASYEEALKKQPAHAGAREALTSVLRSQGRTPSERYNILLLPAARWLALELYRREMEAGISAAEAEGTRRLYRAQVYNFFGALALATAQNARMPSRGSFFDLAVEDFQWAIELYPNWYQPYENLGQTYAIWAAEAEGDRRGALFQQAQSQYGEALERLVPYLAGIGSIDQEHARRRIRLGLATVLLWLGRPDEARLTIQNVKRGWDHTRARDAQLLYNVGAWHGIAVKLGSTLAEDPPTARRFLAYALVRDTDRQYWEHATGDPDFERVCSPENVRTIEARIDEHEELATLEGPIFAMAIDEILAGIAWQA